MLPVTVAGHELAEFCAKMQSYPEISACAVDTGIFQGVNRSSMQLLHNRRGVRYMDCKIDFFGMDNYERTLHQSEFEALFLGTEPVSIDIGDGFWYSAVLTEIGDTYTERELITTVEYRFRVARHRGPQISAQVVPNDAKIFCQSNVARTDCIVRILYDNLAEAKNTVIYLNGLAWSYAPVLTGDIVLDGVNKTFTVDGKNATSKIVWEDFPFLIPGENKISVSVNGVVVSHKSAEIIYTPTFL